MNIRCELWRDEIKIETPLLQTLDAVRALEDKLMSNTKRLSHVTLTTQQQQLTLRIGRTRTIVETTLPCVNGLPKQQTETAQTVGVPLAFLRLWQQLTARSVGMELETGEGWTGAPSKPVLKVTTDEGAYDFPLDEPDEVAELPVFDAGQALTLPSAELARILQLTYPCIAKADERYDNTDCLCIDQAVGECELNFIGTDGHQMTWLQLHRLPHPEPQRLLLPRDLYNPDGTGLLNCLLQLAPELQFQQDGNWLMIRAGLVTVWHYHAGGPPLVKLRTPIPPFPNYRLIKKNLVKLEPAAIHTLNGRALQAALAQVLSAASRNETELPVTLSDNAGGILLKTDPALSFRLTTHIEGVGLGGWVGCRIDARKLHHMLQRWPSQDVELYLYPLPHPIELRPTQYAADDAFLLDQTYYLMPMAS
jgi:hypothetical protein